MRRKVSVICALLAFIFLLTSQTWLIVSKAQSTDENQNSMSFSGQVMVLDNDADAYLQKDNSAEKKESFKAGDSVFVTGQDEEWFEIFYKGDTLYISRQAISSDAYASNEASINMQAQAVEEELKGKEKADQIVIESYEAEKARNISSLIWKGAIVVLVILIIALSVFIGISNNKTDKEQREAQEEK